MCIMEYPFRFVKSKVEGIFRFTSGCGKLGSRRSTCTTWLACERSGVMAESDIHASGERMRKDVRRNLERVLQAAHELFAERGTDVTMEEVARHAGVGIGTVYRRFPSKEHLFVAV